MPSILEGRISIGAFYNPHLAQELLRAGELIGHLAMADPPASDDASFPYIRDRFPLLLHDYLGQLSDPLSPHALDRARQLQDMYRSPWVAEHFQCLHTQDHDRTLDYVFPPLYTEEFLQRFEANARVLQDAVGAPLVMENIPGFFSLEHTQMSEAKFLRRFFVGQMPSAFDYHQLGMIESAHQRIRRDQRHRTILASPDQQNRNVCDFRQQTPDLV